MESPIKEEPHEGVIPSESTLGIRVGDHVHTYSVEITHALHIIDLTDDLEMLDAVDVMSEDSFGVHTRLMGQAPGDTMDEDLHVYTQHTNWEVTSGGSALVSHYRATPEDKEVEVEGLLVEVSIPSLPAAPWVCQ
jgi:hypothetical protein